MKSLYTELTYALIRQVAGYTLAGDAEKITDLGVRVEDANTLSRLQADIAVRFVELPAKKVKLTINNELLTSLASKPYSLKSNDNGFEDISIKILSALARMAGDTASRAQLQSEFNLSQELIDSFATKTLGELHDMSSTGVMFYTLEAKEPEFSMALDFVRVESNNKKDIQRLINADISQPMFTSLTGLNKQVFKDMRRGIPLPSCNGGQPKKISDEQIEDARQLWISIPYMQDIDRCLHIYEHMKKAGVTLRALWPHLKEWIRTEEREISA